MLRLHPTGIHKRTQHTQIIKTSSCISVLISREQTDLWHAVLHHMRRKKKERKKDKRIQYKRLLSSHRVTLKKCLLCIKSVTNYSFAENLYYICTCRRAQKNCICSNVSGILYCTMLYLSAIHSVYYVYFCHVMAQLTFSPSTFKIVSCHYNFIANFHYSINKLNTKFTTKIFHN